MAGRPIKQGLEYFPLDVDFFNDEKIEFLSARFGTRGEAITLRLLCKIYRIGYNTPWSDDEALLLAKRCGDSVTQQEVSDVIDELLRRNFFDQTIYDQYHILTSRAIQKRYTRAVGERKCIEICPEIWLIDEPKNATYIEIITEKEPDSDINRPINSNNRPKNTQSKVKESKAKERIIYPYQEVADYWNEHFTSFPKVIKLNDTRRIKIGQRLNEMGLDTWREVMRTLCERMQASPFLRGETTDWKASFDWLMANPTNWIKVVEGNYQNNKSKKMAEQANDRWK